MLEGEIDYRHGGKLHRLCPGDTMMFDTNAQHGPERLLRHPIRYLSIIVYPRGALMIEALDRRSALFCSTVPTRFVDGRHAGARRNNWLAFRP